MIGDKKLCYVIMPYDTKRVGWFRSIDFERVYKTVIEPSRAYLRKLGHEIEFMRSKDEKKTGEITAEFINGILRAEIAIVDVSMTNSNVFYELGLRHAFRRRTTVIIAREGTILPFDIGQMRVIFYEDATETQQKDAAKKIAECIAKSLNDGDEDSPVYKAVRHYHVSYEKKPCPQNLTYVYEVREAPGKQIGITAGDLNYIRDIDVWVNSENTDMEMARVYDRSVSGLIRYLGATHDEESGWIQEDVVQSWLSKGSRQKRVSPAHVIETEPGSLSSQGVKKLLHVAAFEGHPGEGYEPVKNLEKCVEKTLRKIRDMNLRAPKRPALQSVLFPIFGTGTQNADKGKVLSRLVTAACEHVKMYPDSVQTIYFQAHTEEELSLCRATMSAHAMLNEINSDFLENTSTNEEEAFPARDGSLVVSKIKELMDRAMQLRRSGDLEGAIELLQSGAEEGRQAPADVRSNAAVAEVVADCIGMLGGNLTRARRMSEARAAYRMGSNIEMNVPGVTMTYNTVNFLVIQLLDDGWKALSYATGEIEEVVARLQRKANNGQADLWALADLGMCRFLRGDFEAALEAYKKAAAMCDQENRRSMLERLTTIEARWSEESIETQGREEDTMTRSDFYKEVRAVLSPEDPPCESC